jgi:hypothetical protein
MHGQQGGHELQAVHDAMVDLARHQLGLTNRAPRR